MHINGLSSNATAAAGTVAGADRGALAKAAQQFEAIFLRQMIGAMRSASLAEGITDSGATQQFRDMADARTADAMANKGSLGIADMLLAQFGGTKPAALPTGPIKPDGPAKSDAA